MTLILNAHIHATPGQRDQLKAELLKLVPPTRAEVGCNFYELHEDLSDENHFMFHESWKNREASDQHMKTDHIAAFRAVTAGMIADFKLYEMRKLD